MANISNTNSTYGSGGIDTQTTLDGTFDATFQQMNGAASAAIAIETVLGDAPTLKGNKADLVARLSEVVDADGKLIGHSLDGRTNTSADGGKLFAETSGTPGAGIGTALLFQAESQDESPSDILRLGAVYDDITTASEDSRFVVWLRVAGAVLTRVWEFATTSAFKGIFTHANTADRTYTFPNRSMTVNNADDGASMTLIETLDLSSVNVVSNLGSTYDEHIFQLIDVLPGTTNSTLIMTVSGDNGATYADSNYSYIVNDAAAATGQIRVNILAGVAGLTSVSTINGLFGYIVFVKPQLIGRRKSCRFWVHASDTTGAPIESHGMAAFLDTSPDVVTNAINAVKIEFTVGTIAGTLRHYGVKNQ